MANPGEELLNKWVMAVDESGVMKTGILTEILPDGWCLIYAPIRSSQVLALNLPCHQKYFWSRMGDLRPMNEK